MATATVGVIIRKIVELEQQDADAAARACAALLVAVSGHVVLTGGSTPERAYDVAATLRTPMTTYDVSADAESA